MTERLHVLTDLHTCVIVCFREKFHDLSRLFQEFVKKHGTTYMKAEQRRNVVVYRTLL
jgi:hypothetical protein